jgi:hypothetical protein
MYYNVSEEPAACVFVVQKGLSYELPQNSQFVLHGFEVPVPLVF